MTQTGLDQSSAASYAILVTLRWGDTNVVRLCRWTSDIVIGGDTYTAIPSLSVELGENHGGTDDKPAKLTCPNDVEPLATMAKGYRHALVRATVSEIDPSDVTTKRDVFWGKIDTITKNPSGKKSMLRASIVTVKASLDQLRLGFAATTECQNILGDALCRAAVTEYNGTITAIGSPAQNSLTVSIPGITPAIDLRNSRFRRGRIVVDRCAIMIRSSYATGVFDLFSLVPPEWLGKSCKVFSGCDKTLAVCRTEYANEINFNGLGILTPSRNPVFEE